MPNSTPVGVASPSPVVRTSPSPTEAPLAFSPAPLQPQFSAPPEVAAIGPVKPLFGHLPYTETDPSRLEAVGRFIRGPYERDEILDFEAVQAFQAMVAAASAEGVNLMPISGFRSIADQQILFEKQVERQGSEAAAARLSAPPGHSEHHTGYAIDIADIDRPDADLKFSFQDTNAYRWLFAHAYQFGFEQSFPPNNWQGVSYEPWHWRYVQSPRAAQIFAVAKGGG